MRGVRRHSKYGYSVYAMRKYIGHAKTIEEANAIAAAATPPESFIYKFVCCDCSAKVIARVRKGLGKKKRRRTCAEKDRIIRIGMYFSQDREYGKGPQQPLY